MTWCPDAPSFVVPPKGWGAAYASRYDPSNGRQVIVPCSRIVVHHSASNQPAPGGEAAFSRQIENYGETRAGDGGCAVEYNFLVYPSGVVHGGFGDTRGCHASAKDPAGQPYNVTAVGVCFVGYFHAPQSHRVTPQAVDAFRALVAWLVSSGRVSSAVYAKAAANGLPGWYGHRDVSPTACPGDTLYPELGRIFAQPNQPPQPTQPEEADPMMTVRMKGYHNVFYGPPWTNVTTEMLAKLPAVTEVAHHEQLLTCMLHQSGLERSDLVPDGTR